MGGIIITRLRRFLRRLLGRCGGRVRWMNGCGRCCLVRRDCCESSKSRTPLRSGLACFDYWTHRRYVLPLNACPTHLRCSLPSPLFWGDAFVGGSGETCISLVVHRDWLSCGAY